MVPGTSANPQRMYEHIVNQTNGLVNAVSTRNIPQCTVNQCLPMGSANVQWHSREILPTQSTHQGQFTHPGNPQGHSYLPQVHCLPPSLPQGYSMQPTIPAKHVMQHTMPQGYPIHPSMPLGQAMQPISYPPPPPTTPLDLNFTNEDVLDFLKPQGLI